VGGAKFAIALLITHLIFLACLTPLAAPAGEEFPAFPFPPYDIQLGFMRALYRALEEGGVGLFESPTGEGAGLSLAVLRTIHCAPRAHRYACRDPAGTGKTLSLICGSLQWLQDHRAREAAAAAAAQAVAQAAAAAEDEDVPAWMRDFASQQASQREAERAERRARRLAKARAKLGPPLRQPPRGQQPASLAAAAAQASQDPDAEFLVDEYVSADEGGGGGPGAGAKRPLSLAPLSDSEAGGSGSGGGEEEEEDDEEEGPRKVQIIFCSRTHSQLTQFVGELHRTPFADSMALVALGSRRALCVNDAVLRLSAPALINERCLELQKPASAAAKRAAAAAADGAAAAADGAAAAAAGGGPRPRKAASGRCPFLAAGSQAAATTRDMILAHPLDIEELAKLGRRRGTCPYYAARRAVGQADVVLAPYSALLVADTRRALGLRVEGSVVVVDEGHNLGEWPPPRVCCRVCARKKRGVACCLVLVFFSAAGVVGFGTSVGKKGAMCASTKQTGPECARFLVLTFFSCAAPGAVDAINSSRSAALTAATAAAAARQLAAYFDRFRTRLAPGNARNIQSLLRVAEALARAAAPPAPAPAAPPAAAAAPPPGGRALTVNDFLFSTGLDNVNMFRLVGYVRESKAVFKIAGFCQAAAQREASDGGGGGGGGGVALGGRRIAAEGAPAAEGSTGALHALVAFLQALTNNDADGRVIIDPGAATLKFVLLNAAAHFAAVVASARAVVLASGTLAPLDAVLPLFASTPEDRIHRFACGHVVGRERLLALALGSGPGGAPLDFRHASRGAPATMDELGRVVANVCGGAPGGVVVFFPSFAYADAVHARWGATGALAALGARKRVFREPRGAGEVEATLAAYGRCIEEAQQAQQAQGGGRRGGGGGGGAVLLCVVGGKLAEGINFGDALGRVVLVVGLPYPNAGDPELQERLRYIDRAAGGGGVPPGTGDGNGNGGGPASREHYLNLCMKAVNQCVGRVIRHQGDYAAILLLDAR
jgi:chromosome transmission fidelity protein 1